MTTQQPTVGDFFSDLASAIQSEDLPTLEKLYHPDAEWYPPQSDIISGWSAIQKAYQEQFVHYKYELAFQTTEVTFSDQLAFVTGATSGTITSKNYGDIVPLTEKFVAIVSKSDNWQLKRLIWNQNPISRTVPENKKVTGIGGIFFKSENPEQLRAWYATHLGLVVNPYGSLFEFRQGAAPEKRAYLQWSPFSQNTTYFEPSGKEFMLNYRVENMEHLVETLKKDGITVCDDIETYEYGKFVHILDLENNKIELWEPIDSAFTALYKGKTTM